MPYRPPSQRALTPGGRGRFPGFDVPGEVDCWDDVTAGVVLARLDPQPDYSFFTPLEQATGGALLDQLLAQTDEPKVLALLLVDRRLALDETDDWYFEDMPEDRDAWRMTLAADDDARETAGASFHQLDSRAQGRLIQAVHDADDWHGLTAPHVWSLWTRYACAAFYSHPGAWNEIGVGGPAYPRGYQALGVGQREGWEVPDASGTDPVPWAARVEQARTSNQQHTGTARPEDRS